MRERSNADEREVEAGRRELRSKEGEEMRAQGRYLGRAGMWER